MKIFYISFHCAGEHFVRGRCYLFRRNDIVFSIVCVSVRVALQSMIKISINGNYGSWEIVKCENEDT